MSRRCLQKFHHLPPTHGLAWDHLHFSILFINAYFFQALKYLDATQVALSNYLITLLGLPIAAIWLGERLSNQAIAGGILVLFSTLILTILDHKKTNKNLVAV